MAAQVVAMGGAAWLRSRIASFKTKDKFIEEYLKGYAFADKPEATRRELLSQVYDLAKKK